MREDLLEPVEHKRVAALGASSLLADGEALARRPWRRGSALGAALVIALARAAAARAVQHLAPERHRQEGW